MCQIIVAPAGKKIDMNNLKKAQVHNEDGYGVSWYEDGEVKTHKTMDFGRFCGIVAGLKKYSKVVHLRYATVGDVTMGLNHPFEIPTGMLFHNGTISNLKPKYTDKKNSDSKMLAELLDECDYDSILSIEPLITKIVGTTINRVVTMEHDGGITIINENLGMWDEGIWYSNDYHKKPESWCRYDCKPKTKKKEAQVLVMPKDKKESPPIPNGKIIPVFVYGTLKRGYHNNILLKGSTFIGKASTVDKWTMVGEGRGFPYVVEKDEMLGNNIVGEVFYVDVITMARLDMLEGVSSNHYKKVKVPLMFNDDKTTQDAIMYVACNKPADYYGQTKLIEWVG